MRRALADGLHGVPPGKLACVVTSLAMAAPPPARIVPQPPGVTLRLVSAPQPDWYRALFRRVGETWLWSSRLAMDEATLAGVIGDPAVTVHVLGREGVDVGLLELDGRVPGVCEIAFFGLAPEATGQGLGRWLMAQALRLAWARPIRRLWVHTCTLDHPAALPFYIRSGFVPFRQEVEVADDPRRTGLHPATAAAHIPMG